MLITNRVFAPKFKRKEIYGSIRKDIGEILRKLCVQKGVEIIETEAVQICNFNGAFLFLSGKLALCSYGFSVFSSHCFH